MEQWETLLRGMRATAWTNAVVFGCSHMPCYFTFIFHRDCWKIRRAGERNFSQIIVFTRGFNLFHRRKFMNTSMICKRIRIEHGRTDMDANHIHVTLSENWQIQLKWDTCPHRNESWFFIFASVSVCTLKLMLVSYSERETRLEERQPCNSSF